MRERGLGFWFKQYQALWHSLRALFILHMIK